MSEPQVRISKICFTICNVRGVALDNFTLNTIVSPTNFKFDIKDVILLKYKDRCISLNMKIKTLFC